MKKILKLTVLSAVLLMFAGWFISCNDKEKEIETENPCNSKRPTDLKPIDWENYNEVYDVYWNAYKGTEVSNDMGRNIKICGWVFQGSHSEVVNLENFVLIDKEKNIFEGNPYTNGIGIYVRTRLNYTDNNGNFIDSLKIKFDEADITKKCYISGTLSHFATPDMNCYWVNPEIIVTNINDINFNFK